MREREKKLTISKCNECVEVSIGVTDRVVSRVGHDCIVIIGSNIRNGSHALFRKALTVRARLLIIRKPLKKSPLPPSLLPD